jgi:hypothetical protein
MSLLELLIAAKNIEVVHMSGTPRSFHWNFLIDTSSSLIIVIKALNNLPEGLRRT